MKKIINRIIAGAKHYTQPSPRRRPGANACKQSIITKLKSLLQQQTPAFAGVTTVLIVAIIFLAIAITPATACPSWLATWRNHSGILPNSSGVPTSGNFETTWIVTADFGSGMQTISGDSFCIFWGSGQECRCRRTAMGGPDTWSNNFTNARGSGIENCQGIRSVPCVGPQVMCTNFTIDDGDDTPCERNCTFVCANIVRYGSGGVCTRAAILQ